MKRFLCVVIAITLLLGIVGLFSGCDKLFFDKEEEKPQLAIIENGVSNYIIIYPTMPTAAETEAVQQIKDKIKDVTDIRLKSISEEFIDEEPDARKIYVGNTAFEAARTAKTALEEYFDGFSIDSSGDDIYMVGASDTALLNAAKYYVENLVEKNYDAQTQTLLFEGCHFDGEKVFPTGFSVENITEYSIIYADNGMSMLSIAKSLQSIIERNTGFSPDIYKDSEKQEGRFEILVGETNRPFSARCYNETSRIMEYEYVIEGCQLQLAFGGYYSGQKCVDDFSFRILRNKDEYLPTGSYYKMDFAQFEQPLTEGADVRIMSANVLSYRWGEAKYSNILPAAQRAEIFAGVLLNYRPDAVGIQETDEPWQQVLPWYFERMAEKDGVEYTYLFGKITHEGKTMVNFSTIAYRSDLYELDESGCKAFSIWTVTPSYFQRVASYVKLTSKTDPQKEFVLVNTHWAHEDHDTVNACAVEQAEIVNSLKNKYKDVTVFCTGDYNNLSTREWKDNYLNKFVWDINGAIASELAKQKGVLITAGGCRGKIEQMHDNIMRDVDDDFIDHIICSGGAYDVMRHDTIRENKCNVLSDHSPIYADVNLK